jgi:heme-degrading monooxygenase HmoA
VFCQAERESAKISIRFTLCGIKVFEGNMLVILFRSKLASAAGKDYDAMNDELEALVRQQPGFVAVKSFKAEDGERLTVVWWKDKESLRKWRDLPRHRVAQATGRQKWYEYYKMEVATIERTSEFEKASNISGHAGGVFTPVVPG